MALLVLLPFKKSSCLKCPEFMQCATGFILGATTYYIYSLLKMAEASINDLLSEVLHDPPDSDVKRQKFIVCVLTRNSKHSICGRHTPKNKLTSLVLKKWISSLAIMKLAFG